MGVWDMLYIKMCIEMVITLFATWLELAIYTTYNYVQFICRNYKITVEWNQKGLKWFTSIEAIKVKS